MLIPLDYYRILGVPPEATDEQLLQAWHDRRLQMPRWEYSEAAIRSRLQLLEQAYQFLSHSPERDRYQQSFFQDIFPETQTPENADAPIAIGEQTLLIQAETQGQASFSDAIHATFDAATDPTATDPTKKSANEPVDVTETHSLFELDIPPSQWGGALLLLYELGEYEEIIKQTELIIQSEVSATLPPDAELESHQTLNDIYLTRALAYLELSREQWRNNHYEQAAQSEIEGLAGLEQHKLLPGVQAEIRTELNKLRPYRILELLSSPLDSLNERQQGLALLHSLLQQRQGIDGTGDDGSELDTDNFLRFIQQIRTYLTVDEQWTIFEAETYRPSAVASYLAAYALIAQGFSQKQPDKIFQAFQQFDALKLRQDICLEKSICALLLGQTEVAIASLRQHQDPKPLGLVQKYSEDDLDWLRGLCIYGEEWLQSEVFSKFLDLADKKPSLKEYFADKRVQDYIDQNLLLLDISPSSSNPSLSPEQTMAIPQPSSFSSYLTPRPRKGSGRRYREAQIINQAGAGNTATLTATAPSSSLGSAGSAPTPTNGNGRPLAANNQTFVTESYVLPPSASAWHPAAPERKGQSVPQLHSRPRSGSFKGRRKRSLKVGRILLLGAALVGCLGAGVGSVKWWLDRQSPLFQLQSDQLFIPIHKAVIDIPAAKASLTAPDTVTPEFAQEIIQNWLTSKSDAFGHQYQSDRLATVLSEPLLAVWKNRVVALQQSKAYWQYDHSLAANSLQVKTLSPNQATIDATVKEKASYFQGGKEKTSRSYEDTLHVRYGITRQDDRWLIESIQVINP